MIQSIHGRRLQSWPAYGHSRAMETPQHQGISERRRAESPNRVTAKLAVTQSGANSPRPMTLGPNPRIFSLAGASSSAAGFRRRHRRNTRMCRIRPSLVQVGGHGRLLRGGRSRRFSVPRSHQSARSAPWRGPLRSCTGGGVAMEPSMTWRYGSAGRTEMLRLLSGQ